MWNVNVKLSLTRRAEFLWIFTMKALVNGYGRCINNKTYYLLPSANFKPCLTMFSLRKVFFLSSKRTMLYCLCLNRNMCLTPLCLLYLVHNRWSIFVLWLDLVIVWWLMASYFENQICLVACNIGIQMPWSYSLFLVCSTSLFFHEKQKGSAYFSSF